MRLNPLFHNSWQDFMKSFDIVRNLTFTLGVFLILIQPVASFATAPRTSALGGDNTYFEDDSNVLRWYGSLVEYGNQVLVGTGHHDFSESGVSWSDSPSGFGTGIHVDLDSQGTWGTAAIYFNQRMRDNDVSTSIDDDPENSLAIMYGRKIGPVTMGLSFRHGSQEWDAAIDTVGVLPMSRRELSRTTVGIGVRTDLSTTSYLDVAFDLHGLNWLNSDVYNADTDLESWNNMSLRTRAFFALGSNMAVVPVAELWSEDYNSVMDNLDLAPTHTIKMLRLGCGLNIFPNSDNFMLVSANYFGIQEDMQCLTSNVYSKRLHKVNVLVATETRWNHWLTLRGSFGCDHFKREDSIASRSDVIDTIFPMNFGAGFHLGGFDLDMAMTSHEPGLLNPNWQSLYSEEPSVQMPGSWFSASLRYLF